MNNKNNDRTNAITPENVLMMDPKRVFDQRSDESFG